jgi:hypothetical protein
MNTESFFSNIDNNLYKEVVKWINDNEACEFYLIAGQQDITKFETFCQAVLDCDKTPVIITNVGSMYKPLSLYIRNALKLSPRVRVYEVAKMAMSFVLNAKANEFIKINGGVLWTP